MPSLSPSPAKRPSISHRNSSTQSLSSSGKQTSQKVHRPHVVAGRGHTRNASHGRNLSKLGGKVNSTANLVGEARQPHQRKKSGTGTGGTPSTSPRAPLIKRNSSHATLPRNTSHGNLRKNHSANVLARNLSQNALKKVGLAPPIPKQTGKGDVFELGDQSSDENEEEAEWEDSTTQSPELTRNNSKASTPARVATPNDDRPPQKPPDPYLMHQEKTSSPPAPSLRNNNRSAPDLSHRAGAPSAAHLADPALLHQNPRSSRAPPAMSTISALARTDSTRSFTHLEHADVDSGRTPDTLNYTPRVGESTSNDGGVSHFLSSTTPDGSRLDADDGSDYDSPANFLPNYKPLASESPEKSRNGNRINLPHVPSRTQQRLELQRRETMRGAGVSPTTPPSTGIGFSLGSSASLHSRSGSRGRNRSIAGEAKAMKRDYESATKQLSVVRRFRNPIMASLGRLREGGVLPQDTGVITPAGASTTKSRPQSRRGQGAGPNVLLRPAMSRSFEEKKPSPMASRSSSRGRGGKVQFTRQGSHDDIALSRSRGSEEGEGEEVDGISTEEAMIRRIWETREVFDRPPSSMGREIETA